MATDLIAVFCGGYTGESVISLQSARIMMDALDTTRYEGLFVQVDRSGWTCTRADGQEIPLKPGHSWISVVPASYAISY